MCQRTTIKSLCTHFLYQSTFSSLNERTHAVLYRVWLIWKQCGGSWWKVSFIHSGQSCSRGEQLFLIKPAILVLKDDSYSTYKEVMLDSRIRFTNVGVHWTLFCFKGWTVIYINITTTWPLDLILASTDLTLTPFYSWGNWVTDWQNKLPNNKQQVSGRGRNKPQASWLPRQFLIYQTN